MDLQQLQIARAALWHQTATSDPSVPLRTFEAAAMWLDDLGFSLFLPRHTQLPAPAPSFVEACLGAPAITPAPVAIVEATELLTRLVGERRIIPLNLLGVFSEQPDFLVTPEVLPWVAAVRGDRQWKTAPAGRTAPIVIRTFEALDREGELTAIQIREILGHEITEAAALRALMELWTGLRAMPVAAGGEPTRWTLLKNRFPAQLATAANTSQTTALSALLSLYLRSAVAATAEEVEVFLSPLTARSRIREVVHGLMATRQIGTTTVASQTMLFVEGSLPESEPQPEPQVPAQVPSPLRSAAPPAKSPARKRPRPTRWELPPRETRSQPDQSRPWQKKPPVAHRPQPASDRPKRDEKRSGGPRPAFGRGFTQRPAAGGPRTGPREKKFGDKPWQRRRDAFPPKPFRDRQRGPEDRQARSDRPMPPQPPESSDRPRPNALWRDRPARPAPFRKPGQPKEDRSWRDRRSRPAPLGKNAKPRQDRPWRERTEGRPPFRRDSGPRRERSQGSAPFRRDRTGKDDFQGKRPWRERPAFGAKRPEGSAENRDKPSSRPGRPFRPGKPFSGKPGRPAGPKNKFRKPFPGKQKPRKNRNQEETPE